METSSNLVIARILTTAAKRRASDIHFSIGNPPILRVDNKLVELAEEEIITKSFLEKFASSILNSDHKKILDEKRETRLVHVFQDKIRLRVNIYYQKNSLALSIKLIPIQVPELASLRLPKSITSLVNETRGLIVVCGPYGSGKTTTVAAMIEEINKTRSENIIIIEKPIEYIFTNKESIIDQREVGRDVNSFVDAIKYCQQEDVDVVVIGENYEIESIPLAIDLVNAGRLVFYIMNTVSAIQTIEKLLINFKDTDEKTASRLVAQTLKAVISQRLLPQIGGGKALALEILTVPLSVQSIISDGKIKQLENILQTSKNEGMISLAQSLAGLVKQNLVSEEDAMAESIDKNIFLSATRD